MKDRVVEKPVRRAYEAPKLMVYGKAVDLTQGGIGRGRGKYRSGRGRGGRARGYGGSRS